MTKQANFDIRFPEFSNSKWYKIEANIVEYEKGQEPSCDLIIEDKTILELVIVLNWKENIIKIDKIVFPMQNNENIQSAQVCYHIWKNSFYVEPAMTVESTKCMTCILDAKYEKADLPKIVAENCNHLKVAKKEMLLQLLVYFEQLFDGTLGDWKTSPVQLELKPSIKPWCGKAYPVPHIHLGTLKMIFKRLEKLGVMEWNMAHLVFSYQKIVKYGS